MNKKIKSISDEVADLVIEQLVDELKNYNLYKSFANYCYSEGYLKLYVYYNKRAKEELEHHEWCYEYLTASGVQFMYPEIGNNNIEPKDLCDTFELTVEREIATTESIYKIYDKASELKDNLTRQWLDNKLIKEQTEEESISRLIRDIAFQEDVDWLTKQDAIMSTYEQRIIK